MKTASFGFLINKIPNKSIVGLKID